MPDREKVIKGLEHCIADEWQTCTGCPYNSGYTYDDPHSGCQGSEEPMRDALALLKAQEARVMTEQEMRDAEPGAVIYCEQRDEVRTYLTPLIKYDDGVFENRFLGAEPEATQLPNVRFCTSRPTDEQKEGTPWN